MKQSSISIARRRKLAILYSSANKPFELYLRKNSPGEKHVKITNSLSEGVKSYKWRGPKIVSFKAGDGKILNARIYTPKIIKK